MLDVIGLQGSFQLRSLPPVDQLLQQRVVHTVPVVGGGVIRRDLIRKIPGIVFGAVRADILNDMGRWA